ncbi:MAG TPA: hypothetical protein VLU92_06905 [Candidatus Dormibacteraeota bacterium]|nr:hypothetical protein [Candidatus Dormibacteraeota bacterium]
MRWVSLGAGVALIAIAFAAATQVADTRQGLIAEVVTLLAGLGGISLLLYGMIGGASHSASRVERPRPAPAQQPAVRPATDLLAGIGGIAIALVLLSGLAITGGFEWAGFGLLMLLPMIAGSVYLCVRFARAPARNWKVELKRPRREKQS